MGAQIVHNKNDLLGLFVMPREIFDELRPVEPGFSFRCFDHSFACERFACQKDGIDSASFVFIIMAFQTAPSARNWGASLFDELSRRLVHTHHWRPWAIGTLVHVENLFHGGDKATVCFGRNDPPLLLPGLYFVF